MDEAEVLQLIRALPGAVVVTPGPGSGAPEVAWGDSFAFYDPDDAGDASRRFPFATVVVKDYPGFDTDSRLDRPGVYRLNLPAGRQRFTELFGFPPHQCPRASPPAVRATRCPRPGRGRRRPRVRGATPPSGRPRPRGSGPRARCAARTPR